ncbi:molybdopterin-dependent oxidoreductase [Frigoribacterium sp. 2-23]|uniref:molybdopterin-dependent oxidoreductase n=1 Tax=Frigoribacterium sp. 2-23 TaxID=3415006 RepID=UPI003C6F0138
MTATKEHPPASAQAPASRRGLGAPAFSGVIAMAAFLAVAELVSLVVGPNGSPLFAVGSLAIDAAPKGVKDLMVSTFGTGDKIALFALMGVILVLVTAAAGIVEDRRPPVGKIVFGLGGVIALVAVLTRADATSLDGVPTAVATVVALLVLTVLLKRLRRWRATEQAGWAASTDFVPSLRGPAIERRAFLGYAVVLGVASVVVGTGARVKNAASTAVTAARQAVRLPAAAVTEQAVPAGASLSIDGITPYVTPNDDFYRIDTALQVPSVDPATWSLSITGLVDREVTISYDELLALPLEEHMATLSCVSNEVGGDLIGNALWLGYPIRRLLAQAGVQGGADMVLSTSVDGFTAGTPLSVLQDDSVDALLAVGMNGEPLPTEHGFPVRMVVPGLFGYVSATKWVTSLEVTRFDRAEGYWTPRGWDALGPVKLESRIDTPTTRSTFAPGDTVPIAGVAWEPHTGVAKVEVKVGDDEWAAAELAEAVSDDTWVQWVYRWTAVSGSHDVFVRATSKDGSVQASAYVPPAPNGAEGWDQISLTVSA